MKYLVAIVVVLVASGVWRHMRLSLRIRRLPRMTSPEIKALFDDRKDFMMFLLAARELRGREEDISFAFPLLLDMVALPQHPTERLAGWQTLTEHFSKELYGAGIGASGRKPTEEKLKKVEALLEQWENRTKE